MKSISYLRYLLNDKNSLRQYYGLGKAVSLEDLKHFIMLKVREQQYSVPDHYYRLGVEYSFNGISQLSEIFTLGLPKLAEYYLEVRDKRVYVKGERFNDWQLLLPDIPPLILVISKIWKMFGSNSESMITYAREYILPSVQYTALPSAFLPPMKAIEQSLGGFSDLHIHLNGAVETDLVWYDVLSHPEKVYIEIKEAFQNPKVREQIIQMSNISEPIEFLKLFHIASGLRHRIYQRVMKVGKDLSDLSFADLLNSLNYFDGEYTNHPLRFSLGIDCSPLILEGMLYIKVLDYLSDNRLDFVTAGMFHYYLLILGLFNRLLVQQTDAFGFEQFQKYTTNNFREFTEKSYGLRFLQLAGNDLTGFKHTEGRFSPKDTLEKNLGLTDKIMTGFRKLTDFQKTKKLTCSTLSLVAHFIKKDDGWDGDIRFRKIREELDKKTQALIALKNCGAIQSSLFIGVDAAASEFDTPPEVFAPSFHRLRKAGIRHFTFHAGEDYFHILTGLRAIYEAVIYLDLQAGDRIGHAVASGVDVSLWRSNIGERMWIRKEDYLDDLVFSYFLISTLKERDLEHLLPFIALRCEQYASEIYGNPYGIHELIEAWKYREKDPFDDKMYSHPSEEIFRYRHSKIGREKGREIICVDTYDIFEESDLIKMQLLLLKEIHDRQIVFETLPTSNIIIGQHHEFKTYHIYNWYKWGKEGHPIPAIVVGCDDAGIFATNIYNEYCHIYCLLVFEKGLTSIEAITFIQHLARNADIYRFK